MLSYAASASAHRLFDPLHLSSTTLYPCFLWYLAVQHHNGGVLVRVRARVRGHARVNDSFVREKEKEEEKSVDRKDSTELPPEWVA